MLHSQGKTGKAVQDLYTPEIAATKSGLQHRRPHVHHELRPDAHQRAPGSNPNPNLNPECIDCSDPAFRCKHVRRPTAVCICMGRVQCFCARAKPQSQYTTC